MQSIQFSISLFFSFLMTFFLQYCWNFVLKKFASFLLELLFASMKRSEFFVYLSGLAPDFSFVSPYLFLFEYYVVVYHFLFVSLPTLLPLFQKTDLLFFFLLYQS